MTTIVGVRGELPANRVAQPDVTAAFAEVIGLHGRERGVLERIHANAGVRTRHLALPLDAYAELDDFGAANDAFVAHAVDLGADALGGALTAGGLGPRDVDLVVSATVTGVAVPSLEARIAARLGMRPDVKRVPLMGLGCVAGAAGVARLDDYLIGHPDQVAALVAVELCSLTLQRGDPSRANLVASGLFGDGAGAVVAVGASHPARGAGETAARPLDDDVRPVVEATRSRLYPGTERAMGWDVGATGLRIVLGAEVPELVRMHVAADVDGFLAAHGLVRDDVTWWVSHPGGPKVLHALQEALGLDDDALSLTWASLGRIGNLSSASVLHVLEDTLRTRPPAPGSYGLMLAMGPGFCLELVLLRA